MKISSFVFAVLACAVTFSAHGQTVFHYRVSGSDSGTVSGGSVPSVTGPDGAVSGPVSLSSDIPVTGVPAGMGNRSLTFDGGAGVLATGTRQLLNSTVHAAGGFTFEAWFKYTGAGNVNSIIDYAGTEKLVRRAAASGVSMTASGVGDPSIGAAGVNQWHYAAVVFSSTGLAGVDITGDFTFYLDDNAPISTLAGQTIDDFGDSLNRTIGVGMHPLGFAGDFFQGLIYEPRVSLGALAGGQLLYSSRPGIAAFTATPQNITAGQTSTLAWDVSDADAVTISGVAGPLASDMGSVNVSPTTTTLYTLTATNANGDSTLPVTVFVGSAPLEPILNEFMADNTGILRDEDGEASDWIELKNPNPFSLDVTGWSLTDDPLLPQKWTLPAGAEIPGNGFLIVFASGKDRRDPAGELHANFLLSGSGEYLALVRADASIASEFAPDYPKQFEDVAYGTQSGGASYRYLTDPTPGAENSAAGVIGFVEDTKFSPDRGFYDTEQVVTITSLTPGATIVYTSDSSTPTLSNGTQVPAADGATPPTATVNIAQTTTLRAAAFLADHEPTNTDTHTYVFLDDVVLQSSNGAAPAGWPSGSVNGQSFDYGMDPNIVNHATYGPQLRAAMLQIPSLSIVTDQNHLTGASDGIYTHAGSDGDTWERPTSVELLNPDNSPAFQVNAGVRIRGGFSRGGFNPKHSFRLFFRSEYGASRLQYQMFGPEGADDFDKIDLRTAQNYAWSNNTGNNERHNTFIRDVFHRDSQRDVGQPYTRSAYYHLYLNGQYWGLYQTQERSESAYANSYLGGKREGWDVVKPSGGSVNPVDGNIDAYRALHSLALAGFSTDAAYFAAQGKDPDGSDNPSLPVYLDVDNLIDYMLINFFCGNRDGPLDLGNSGPNNFYGIRNREATARDPWRFLCHDSEHSMSASNHSLNNNVTTTVSTGQSAGAFNPRWLSQQLAQNTNYQRRFADRAHQHLFNGGALTEEKNIERWNARAAEIDLAIIAESARWGDQHNEPPLDKQTWQTELDWITDVFFAQRKDVLLGQLRSAGLYPSIEAPSFNPHGGSVPSGFGAVITEPGGAIFYTTDGSDPRGEVTQTSTTLLAEDAAATALIPTADIGSNWRGGAEPFDDSSWLSGTTGIGYEASPGGTVDYTEFIGIDVEDMRNDVTSVYARARFTVADPAAFNALTLKMRYEDGFVAFINGVEVASANKPGSLQWNSATNNGATNSDTAAIVFERFDITTHLGILNVGENILAIHGLNANLSSSDLLLEPEITGSFVETDANGIAYSGPITLTEQSTLRAAVLQGGQWSAVNEATFLIDAVPADSSNLVISEFSYRPASPSEIENPGGTFDRGDFEFVELQNIGTDPIDLSGVRFTDGIDFQFEENTVLQAGAYLVIVKNQAAFSARYPGVTIADTFGGSLSNDGEQVILSAADDSVIRNFTYNDQFPWPTSADGGGYSLVLVCASSNPDHNEPASWRPSSAIHGTPGSVDGQSYADWAIVEGIAGGPSDDDDHNGLANLFDYAIAAPPEFEVVNGQLGIEVEQNLWADDASLEIQVSSDLVNWSPLSPASASNNRDGTRTLTYVSSGAGVEMRWFARLRVIQN
ncbi:MAG: hypothetical protein ACI9NC_001803 [Verrucomicrobiales bacterium]|jgi:hypothetical protein